MKTKKTKKITPYQFGGNLKKYNDLNNSWNSLWDSSDIFGSDKWLTNRWLNNQALYPNVFDPLNPKIPNRDTTIPNTNPKYDGTPLTSDNFKFSPDKNFAEPIFPVGGDNIDYGYGYQTGDPYKPIDPKNFSPNAALTDNLSGIFSGLNALNNYQPVEKFNQVKGVKGYQKGGTPLDAYSFIASKFPSVKNQMSRDSFITLTGNQQRDFIQPYTTQIKQQGDSLLQAKINQGGQIIDSWQNPLFSEVNLQKESFKKAFADARSQGLKAFEFDGKLYGTHLSTNPYEKTSNKVVKKRMSGPLGELQWGGIINTTGYTPGMPSMDNEYNIIPSNNITMRNTPFPVMGYGDGGEQQLMMPGQDYVFPESRKVLEVPVISRSNPTVQGYNSIDIAKKQLANQAPVYTNNDELLITDHDANWDYRKVNGQWQTKRKGAERWITPKGAALASIEKAFEGKSAKLKKDTPMKKIGDYTLPDWVATPQTIKGTIKDTIKDDSFNLVNMSMGLRGEPINSEVTKKVGDALQAGTNAAGSTLLSGKANPWLMGGAFLTGAAEKYFNDSEIAGEAIGTIAGTIGAYKGAKWVAGKAIDGAKSLVTGKTPGTVVNTTTGKTFIQKGSDLIDETGAVFNKAGVKIKESSSQAANSVKEFFRRGESIHKQKMDDLFIANYNKAGKRINSKGKFEKVPQFQDTRGTLQKMMEDGNLLKSTSNVVKSAVISGKKLTKEVYNKLTETDKKTYDKFFKDIRTDIQIPKDKPIASKIFQERSNRGPATSWNGFKYGGFIPKYQYGGVVNTADDYNTTIIDPNNTEEYSAIQTEIGETILLPNGNLVRVKADRLHKHMKDNVVTDIVPINSYVFSNDKKMILTKDKMVKGLKLSDIIMGKPIIEYKENDNTKGLQDIRFTDIFGNNKALTPAQISERIKSKFKLEDDFDYFTERSNKENKEQRYDYFQLLTQLSEAKKPLSKQTPMFKYGGYTVPKASLGKLLYYTLPPAFVAGEFFGNKAKKKQEKVNAEDFTRTQGIYDNYMKQAGYADDAAIAGNIATMLAGLNVPLAKTNDYNQEISRTNSAYDRANRILRNNIAQPNYSALNYSSINPRMDLAAMLSNNINQSNAINSQINNQLAANTLQQNDLINRYTTQATDDRYKALFNRDNALYNANLQAVQGIGQSVTDKYSNLANRTFDKDMNLEQMKLLHRELAQNRKNALIGEIQGGLDTAGNLALSAFSKGLIGGTGSQTATSNPATINPSSTMTTLQNTRLGQINPTSNSNTGQFWQNWINPITGQAPAYRPELNGYNSPGLGINTPGLPTYWNYFSTPIRNR